VQINLWGTRKKFVLIISKKLIKKPSKKMGKTLINMIGGGFQHDVCSSAGSIPQYIEWVKGSQLASISIHIDYAIANTKVNKKKKNFAWLAESKTINSDLYLWCSRNINYLEKNFELIFTHDESLAQLSNKIKMVICNVRPWVKDVGIHEKTKMLSMIASSKIMCREHIYRQEIIKKFRGRMDHFGRGFKEIEKKEDGLKDYYFSIAMENGTYPLMYSEKIADCFAMGTIPIYYGSDKISNIFDSNGIIVLDNNFDPSNLSVELYHSKMPSIINNFDIIMSHPTGEDYIYNNYIK
jgi:hypothetical protein